MIINPSAKIRNPLEKHVRFTVDIFSMSTLILYGVYYELLLFFYSFSKISEWKSSKYPF